jgi:hypothetical protein
MSPDISRGVELRGWKQIADYLNVSERTAKSWETYLKLPVYRLPGDRGRLFANTVELETWKRARSRPAPVPAVRKAITVRLPETSYVRARQHLSAGDFRTMQDLILRALDRYLDSPLPDRQQIDRGKI